MKKDFPVYKSISKSGKRISKSNIVFDKLKPKDKKIISDFMLDCSINSKAEKRVDNRKRIMIQLCDFMEKPLSKIENDYVLKFLEALNRTDRSVNGKNDIKQVVKRFLRWFYKDWEKRFNGLKVIKYEAIQGSGKINSPNDLITELEFDKLMKSTSNIMHKTLISMLWESASRPEEILKLRWVDIDFIKKTIKLHSSKTKRFRVIPIDLTINHLERLKEESDLKEEDFVFVSKHQGKQMGNAGLNSIITTLRKKASINKYISPYTFRHTRLSYLIKKLSPKAYENFAGHSLEMGMKTYAHLSIEDLTDEMKEKVFGRKELTKDDRYNFEKEIEELRKNSVSKKDVIRMVQQALMKTTKPISLKPS